MQFILSRAEMKLLRVLGDFPHGRPAPELPLAWSMKPTSIMLADLQRIGLIEGSRDWRSDLRVWRLTGAGACMLLEQGVLAGGGMIE